MARLTVAFALLLAACSFDVQTDPYLGLDRFEAAADLGADPTSPDAALDAPTTDPGGDHAASRDTPPPACSIAADCLDQVTLPGPCHRPQCDAGTCAADATCTDLKPKSSGAPRDDADPCTSPDQCDALGVCTGSPVPEPCP